MYGQTQTHRVTESLSEMAEESGEEQKKEVLEMEMEVPSGSPGDDHDC